MNVLIRTDIGSHHGMGHAVRMLALARELQRRGASVTFVTATDALRNYVVPFRCDIGVGPQAVTTPSQRGDILIVDTKADDWANDNSGLWLARDAGLRVVRIDYPYATPESCDLLIGPCAHWDTATVTRLRTSFGTRFLYGWEYVLLEPLMTLMPPVTQEQTVTESIVFTAGGSDPTHALQRMYDFTASFLSTKQLIFLVGSQAEMLDTRSGTKRLSPTLVVSFDRVWLRSTELVVTLFGVTSYEALWWEVPQVIFAHTEENKRGARQFAAQMPEMAICRGDIHRDTPERAQQTLKEMLEQGPYVPRPAAFDGLGVQRVAQAICELATSSTCTQ